MVLSAARKLHFPGKYDVTSSYLTTITPMCPIYLSTTVCLEHIIKVYVIFSVAVTVKVTVTFSVTVTSGCNCPFLSKFLH